MLLRCESLEPPMSLVGPLVRSTRSRRSRHVRFDPIASEPSHAPQRFDAVCPERTTALQQMNAYAGWLEARSLSLKHPPLHSDPLLGDAIVAKGPLRRWVASSLRILSISLISLGPVSTSSMSSIFPLRASCAFSSN